MAKRSYEVIDRQLNEDDWRVIEGLEWTPAQRELLGHFAGSLNCEVAVLAITVGDRPLAAQGTSLLDEINAVFSRKGLLYRLVKNFDLPRSYIWRDRRLQLVPVVNKS